MARNFVKISVFYYKIIQSTESRVQDKEHVVSCVSSLDLKISITNNKLGDRWNRKQERTNKEETNARPEKNLWISYWRLLSLYIKFRVNSINILHAYTETNRSEG